MLRGGVTDSNRDQLSAVYVGSGAQFSFTGTGLFRATGQGKVMEAVAFRNGANGPTGGTMRLTGAITGEAITEASENGSGYKAIGVKAENAGTIIFSGKSAWLKAMAHAGTADGVYARYRGRFPERRSQGFVPKRYGLGRFGHFHRILGRNDNLF